MYNKVKDKVCPVNTMAYRGCRGMAPLRLNPVTRRRWVGQHRTPATVPQGKNSGTNRTGD